MKTRTLVLATVIALSGAAADYRLEHSSCFQRYFRSLRAEEPQISPLQRLFLSVVLAGSGHSKPAAKQ
jgi:hypothetical protein